MTTQGASSGGGGGGGGGIGGGGAFCGGFGGGASSPDGCRNGLRECSPPPFVTKLFTMVNDPKTNSIISWSTNGDSFIIWDHLEFSANLLLSYFKHNNLSSFIYQLNNYGFRKCGVAHQWEYTHPQFEAGKEYLLMNIRRRNQIPGATVTRRRSRRTSAENDVINNGVEITILENEIAESKLEIEMLKQKQAEMESEIESFQSEFKSDFDMQLEKLNAFLAKTCREIFQRRDKIGKENEGDEKIKKRKLDHTSVSLLESGPVLSMDGSAANLVQPGGENENMKGKSGDYMYWEKMMSGNDENEERLMLQRAKERAEIAAEMQDLIAKLPKQDAENNTILLQ